SVPPARTRPARRPASCWKHSRSVLVSPSSRSSCRWWTSACTRRRTVSTDGVAGTRDGQQVRAPVRTGTPDQPAAPSRGAVRQPLGDLPLLSPGTVRNEGQDRVLPHVTVEHRIGEVHVRAAASGEVEVDEGGSSEVQSDVAPERLVNGGDGRVGLTG